MTRSDEEHLLLGLLTFPESQPLLSAHRWADERSRELEFVISLLRVALPGQEGLAREVCVHLQRRRLLSLDLWRGGALAVTKRRTETVLKSFGFTAEDRARATHLLADAAHALGKFRSGKVQQWLRYHCETMRDAMVRDLATDAVDTALLGEAVTHFLQNALGAPLSLPTGDIEQLAETHGLNAGDLIAAADDLDLTVPALDDLARAANLRDPQRG